MNSTRVMALLKALEGALFVLLILLPFSEILSVPAGAVGQFHTVTFAENDSGSDAVVATETEEAPTPLTLFASMNPAFVNSGQTFVDWNTQADGSGATYTDGETYNFASPLVLYAIWSSQFHTVTFGENDNSGDSVTATQTANTPSSLTLFTNLTPSFVNSGHTFVDWNTQANGSGTTYTDGEGFSFGSALELYAIWSTTSNVVLTFNVNGGVGSIIAVSGSQGSSTTLPLGSGLSKSNFGFEGWNTSAGGSGTEYGAGESILLENSEALYAQWVPIITQTPLPTSPQVIDIGFSANGGSGSLTSLNGVAGSALALPGSSELIRPGYTFTSWNTFADGSGTSYAGGASVTFTSSTTLYAQWKATSTSTLYGAVGVFSKNSTALTETLIHQVNDLASAIKVKKYTKVSLYGYTAQTGLATLNSVLSTARAVRVASYLRHELHTLHVEGVHISASGEGAVSGSTSSLYSRVEVFVS
jgi:outer membrane protein OmpA-like peptidoglycan-associated protein